MKLNLQCGTNLRNGWINVNSHPINIEQTTEEVKFHIGDYRNLDSLVEDNSVEEIVFSQPMNVVKANEVIPILSNWRKKLKISSKLTISIFDTRRVARALYMSDISLADAHIYLLGANNEFQSIVDTNIERTVLEQCGFVIDSINIDGLISTITSVKSNA
jgi:hypothetical protein